MTEAFCRQHTVETCTPSSRILNPLKSNSLMPRLFFHRRHCGAQKEPAPTSSSQIKEKSTLHSACRCHSGKQSRPLRVFCIPCVFVSIKDVHAAHPSPNCDCQCKSAFKSTTPEVSNTSPVQMSATTDMTPANVPTPHLPGRIIPVAQHIQESQNQGTDQTASNLRRVAPHVSGNTDANRRSATIPSSMLHDVNANMTVVLNLSEAGQTIYPPYLPDGRVEHALTPREVDSPNMASDNRSDQHPSSRSYSTSESGDVFEEDSDVTEETSYDTLVKQLQQSKFLPFFAVSSIFMPPGLQFKLLTLSSFTGSDFTHHTGCKGERPF